MFVIEALTDVALLCPAKFTLYYSEGYRALYFMGKVMIMIKKGFAC